MSIARFEPVTIQAATRSVDVSGEASTVLNNLFMTQGRIRDVKNSLKLNELYRLYADYVNIQMNFTPLTLDIVENQENYALFWRERSWRIVDAVESDDRMDVTFLCYFAKPGIKV